MALERRGFPTVGTLHIQSALRKFGFYNRVEKRIELRSGRVWRIFSVCEILFAIRALQSPARHATPRRERSVDYIFIRLCRWEPAGSCRRRLTGFPFFTVWNGLKQSLRSRLGFNTL